MDAIERLREMCLEFPEAVEKPFGGHDAPAFRIRDKMFAMVSEGGEDVSVWMKALPGAQDILVGGDPGRFFVPPYVGSKGWVGVRLDVGEVPWGIIADLVNDSYRMTAPKRLLKLLDDS
ncbi:MAG: MmcQ/YjbR family DNA-binding protein [Dehalococcoidia bacterium]